MVRLVPNWEQHINNIQSIVSPIFTMESCTANKCSPSKKSFSCSMCGKEFAIFSHLKAHEKIHTGDKPFGCKIEMEYKKRLVLNRSSAHTVTRTLLQKVILKPMRESTLVRNHSAVPSVTTNVPSRVVWRSMKEPTPVLNLSAAPSVTTNVHN